MTYEDACYILGKFGHDFGHLDFEAIARLPEGKAATELYILALGWLVQEGRWEEAGIDPRFVAILYPDN